MVLYRGGIGIGKAGREGRRRQGIGGKHFIIVKRFDGRSGGVESRRGGEPERWRGGEVERWTPGKVNICLLWQRLSDCLIVKNLLSC